MNERDQKLGLNKAIKRRDFVAGVGIALSGSQLSRSWAETDLPVDPSASTSVLPGSESNYPPIRTGIRGNHPGSFEVAHELRNGKQWGPSNTKDTQEEYDLVVVGGGLSGLSAAWFYKDAKPDARILILDNHDDFGGHAKRNEFWSGEKMLLSHGGTINMENFNEYGPAAQRLVRAMGIDPTRFGDFSEKELYDDLKLRKATFFGRETFGSDRLVSGTGEPSWKEFLAKTPLTQAARDDIAMLQETRVDYLPGLSPSEKRDRLQHISYRDFLIDVVGIGQDSLAILQRDGYWAIGIDALTAWAAVGDGAPGTLGLGFAQEEEESTYFRFPDGNASVARLLVRSLVPGVASGSSMEDIVTARFDYDRLDSADTDVRVRLESTVVGVRHLGEAENAQQVEITYVREGQAQRVRAGQTVLACYNSIIPHLCPELPKLQKVALSQSLKAPLVYTSVLVRNWRAFAKLGVYNVHCPGCYFGDIRLSDPISIGDYQHSKSPDEPILLNLYRVPLSPGLPAQEQWKAGRYDLLSTTFETFERHIRDQLGRVLSDGGFDPGRDIEAITVNRWPHGYAYGQNPETGDISYLLDEVPADKAPWLIARQTYGRIAIANSDAAANAMTEGAIGEAHRAIMELLAEPA